MNMEKACVKCRVIKPFEQFSKRARSTDGMQNTCKPCMAAYGQTPEARERDRQRYRKLMATNPEKRRATARAWLAANPDKAKQMAIRARSKPEYRLRQKQWADIDRKRNPERYKANNARYRQRNAEKIKLRRERRRERRLEEARLYRLAHHKELIRKNREYRIANLAKERARSRRYHERKPEVAYKSTLTYRARKRGAFVEHIQPQVVYDRDKGVCGICQRPVSKSVMSIDHVIPLARGGAHSYANVQLAHKRCNSKKHTKTMAELAAMEKAS